MPSESKVTRLLSELTKQTVKGLLSWSFREAPDNLTHGTNDVYPLYFETTFKGQRIGIAQRRYQAYDGEHDRTYWTEDLVLVFRDMHGRIIWESRSQHSALYTLFDAVREEASDIEGILKKLIEEDDDEL